MAQEEAGREIPEPPDYAGMLDDVRGEVAAHFTAPKDATKTKRPRSKKEDDDADSDSEDEEAAATEDAADDADE